MQAHSQALAKDINYMKIDKFVSKNSSTDKTRILRVLSLRHTLGHDTPFQITDKKLSYQKSEDYL